MLHIDGDKDYLEFCMSIYNQLGVPIYGYNVDEDLQHEVVVKYLEKHRPDILILTSHDGLIDKNKGYKDLNNYYCSKDFIKAVKSARRYEKTWMIWLYLLGRVNLIMKLF